MENLDFKLISVNDLESSKLNRRSVLPSGVQVLAHSIREHGLKHPVVCYQNIRGSYTILSGHRRVAAWKMLSEKEPSFGSRIMCAVTDAPKSEQEEKELLMQLNVHRSSKEDIANEVREALDDWNLLVEKGEADSKTEELFESWFEGMNLKAEENPEMYDSFRRNPAKYKRDNFRPRIEYIRINTGLEFCDSFYKNIIRDIEEESESPVGEVAEKTVNEITPREEFDKDYQKFRKKMISFISVFSTDRDDAIGDIIKNFDELAQLLIHYREEEFA